MNIRPVIISIVLLLMSSAVFAQSNVKSDYAIQKKFKEKYKLYQHQLDTVSTPQSASVVIDSVKALDMRYRSNEELLNKALYPDTYDEKIKSLQESASSTKNRISKYAYQSKKLNRLQMQIDGYKRHMLTLNHRTDSLQQAMSKSVQSEKRLSDMVREYRESLEKRDELVMAFIDSMVGTYKQMDIQSLNNLETIDKKSHLANNGNALKIINDIALENLSILDKNSDKLRLQDYMRMSEVENKFEQMWQQLGDKIEKIYEDKDSEDLASRIDSNIDKWDKKVRGQTATAISDTLQSEDINIKSFNDADGFYTSVNAYLDNNANGKSSAGYDEYSKFSNFWDNGEVRWSTSFVDAGLLSRQQMDTLNTKVEKWSDNVSPGSNLLVWLLGIAVLLVIVFGVLFIRERNNNTTA